MTTTIPAKSLKSEDVFILQGQTYVAYGNTWIAGKNRIQQCRIWETGQSTYVEFPVSGKLNILP